MEFTIGIDMQPLYSDFGKNRGIGIYNDHIFNNLFSLDKKRKYILLNPEAEFHFTETPNVKNHWIDFGRNNSTLEGSMRNTIAQNLIQNFIKSYDINLFHFTSPFDLLNIFDYEWYKEISTVATVYDLIPLVYKSYYLSDAHFRKEYMKRIEFIKNVRGIITISNSTRNDLINLLNISPEKIEIIYPGIDKDFRILEKNAEDEKYLNKRYGIDSNYIVYTGGIEFRKNISGLIIAYSMLPDDKKKKYKLVIVCRVSTNDEILLKNFAEKYHVSDRVIFTNYVPKKDLVMLYNYATLSVFPSLYEGFGLPVLEAMTCGIPVVCSNNSSLPEIVGDAGLLVNPFSPNNVSEGMNTILSNETMRENLALHGLERSKNFEWRKSVKLINEFYSKFENEGSKKHKVEKNEKRKIAYFSPLRPNSSGISDYSEELLSVLNHYFDIDIIIDNNYEPSNKFITSTYKIIPVKNFDSSKYEECIYQMGNSEFHTYMLPVMEKKPGITVLHDANLHFLFLYLGIQNNDTYINEMRYNYGIEGEKIAKNILVGKIDFSQLDSMPLLQRIVDHSKGIMVHSQYTAEMLNTAYSNVPIFKIPMGIQIKAFEIESQFTRKKYNCEDCVIISTFGIVANTKRIVELILSYALAYKFFVPKTKLFIVGKNSLDYDSIIQINNVIKTYNLQENIIFHGEVSSEEYYELLSISDLVISLRFPHKGETSLALLKAVVAGKPTIVTNIGSFAELPDDICLKIGYDTNEIPLLTKGLITLVNSQELRINMGKKAFEYFDKNHRLEHAAIKYKEAIDHLVDK